MCSFDRCPFFPLCKLCTEKPEQPHFANVILLSLPSPSAYTHSLKPRFPPLLPPRVDLQRIHIRYVRGVDVHHHRAKDKYFLTLSIKLPPLRRTAAPPPPSWGRRRGKKQCLIEGLKSCWCYIAHCRRGCTAHLPPAPAGAPSQGKSDVFVPVTSPFPFTLPSFSPRKSAWTREKRVEVLAEKEEVEASSATYLGPRMWLPGKKLVLQLPFLLWPWLVTPI